ncbi:hypothetical protein Plec18167_004087 [Paecilomyces lecythidis]|uniref:Zn(2)-C6 fungal-type domain-containing protein n=1 Tax=Paecilomyces lecythidis TaxID=3004212 RepID=A0ABR3XUF0_9EURO
MPLPDPHDNNHTDSSTDKREDQHRQKWRRTRSGCLNCRRRKRKCDEKKPTCFNCGRKNERCEWGTRVTFRAENAHCILEGQHTESTRPSKRQRCDINIIDVTPEVVRECSENATLGRSRTTRFSDEFSVTPSRSQSSSRHRPEAVIQRTLNNAEDGYAEELHDGLQLPSSSSSVADPKKLPARGNISDRTSSVQSRVQRYPMMTPSITEDTSIDDSHQTAFSHDEDTDSLAIRGVHQPLPLQEAFVTDNSTPETTNVPFSPSVSRCWDHVFSTPDGHYEDGIFLPGSEYHELHSTLRKHLMREVRSTVPTGLSSPEYGQPTRWPASVTQPSVANIPSRCPPDGLDGGDDPVIANMSKDDEYKLWKNWLDEIAPWLDKFDNHRHFQHTLPIMAHSNTHLRYAMLALSARQLERKDSRQPVVHSLALYHQAIHLLLPQLHMRNTAVIASCVVLCVLEMLSCSPKAWRRHLDGCASLMETVGINGFVGGVEQALFWCFARMDVCGGLISSIKTLIPVNHWASGIDLDADIGMFRSTRSFDMYANHTVYLCAQALDLLASISSGVAGFSRQSGDKTFAERWLKLWRYIEDWQAKQPAELKPVVNIPSSATSPFPTILYSNPAAISGNQLYHTAAIIMLQNKPPPVHLDPKPRSILWHARRICGISMSNEHHGAWTNCIQPLWIAGRCMSHPSEHKAILDLLVRIERESGWGTKWRMEDLKEFWGDLDD